MHLFFYFSYRTLFPKLLTKLKVEYFTVGSESGQDWSIKHWDKDTLLQVVSSKSDGSNIQNYGNCISPTEGVIVFNSINLY